MARGAQLRPQWLSQAPFPKGRTWSWGTGGGRQCFGGRQRARGRPATAVCHPKNTQLTSPQRGALGTPGGTCKEDSRQL